MASLRRRPTASLRRLWKLVRGRRLDDEVRQELETHLALIENAWKDVRRALRMLRRSPGFTAVAVVTLALGIGVNTAMFSVIDAVLLRPLPFGQPSRLVRVVQHDGGSDVTVSEYDVVREQSRVFVSVAACRPAGERRLAGASGEERVTALAVTAGFLRTLGVSPAIGREVDGSETRAGGPPAVILSDGVWRRSLGADPTVLGRLVTLDGEPFRVIGVLPSGFWFHEPVDALVPLRPAGTLADLGTNTEMLARLKDGVDLRQAQAEIATLVESLRRARAGSAPRGYRGLALSSYQSWFVGDVRLNLLLLFGATGVLLVIACANLAMLLMTRFAARGREVALRAALGASRRRLLSQFLIENLTLAGLGAAASVVTAYALVRGLVARIPFDLHAATPVRLDARVLGFALAVALASAVVFTVLPMLATRRLAVQDDLRAAARSGAGVVRARTRNLLAVGEVALSTALLIAAGLLIQSLHRLHSQQLGFQPERLITFVTPLDRVRAAGERLALAHAMQERLAAVPGVRGVAAANLLPLGGRMNLPTQRAGHPENSIGGMEIRMVTPAYFELLGTPVRRGRCFTSADGAASVPVAVVNEAVARRWWPSGGAIGDRLVIGLFQGRTLVDGPPREVVGIVGDTRDAALDAAPRPTVFVPMDQASGDAARLVWDAAALGSIAWVVRSGGSPNVTAGLRAAIAAIDPGQGVLQLRTMDEVVASSTATSRFNTVLFAVFGAVAVVLATVGLYGVLSFLVASRSQEIGTRMALGARAGDVFGLFLKQGLRLSATGVALGLVVALLVTRWLASLLYGVRPRDPASFGAAAVLLLAVAAAASSLPARRAARIDPAAALRAE